MIPDGKCKNKKMTNNELNAAEVERNMRIFMKMNENMQEDFTNIFLKYWKQNPKMALLTLQAMPLNLFISMLGKADEAGVLDKDFIKGLDVPGSFIRMFKPMEILKPLWGEVSLKEWTKRYREEYEKIQVSTFGEERAEFLKEINKAIKSTN